MRRLLIALLVWGGWLAWAALPALAQEGWPDLPRELAQRGPGMYLSWVKILACWSLFAAWVYTTDWVSSDCQEHRLEWGAWNAAVAGTFFAAFLLVWVLPWFQLSFPLLLAAYAGPLGAYIVYRNRILPSHDQVLTYEHLQVMTAGLLQKFGVRMEVLPQTDPLDSGDGARLKSRGGPTERDENVRLAFARQSGGFLGARQLLKQGFVRRATHLMLDVSPQAVAVRYQTDGVWLDAEPLPSEEGARALHALKTLAGMQAQPRAGRQQGVFAAQWNGVWHDATLTCQAHAGGQRALIQLPPRETPFGSLEELGLRPKVREQLQAALEETHGLVVFSAAPACGLRTTVNVALRGMDRLMRDFAAIHEESAEYEAIENIPAVTYRAENGPGEALNSLFLKEPDVVLARDLSDGQVLRQLCAKAEAKLILTTLRAKDTVECLGRLLALGAPPAEVAAAVSLVVNQRLVRKLCPKCREAYTPAPQVVRQMNLPAGRVPAFYRPPQIKPPTPCEVCGGVGYLGRTGIFEVLVVDAGVRKALQSTPQPEPLRRAARAAGLLEFQEEGLLLVLKGVTSLPELARVLSA